MDKKILKELEDLNVPFKDYLNVQLEMEKLALLEKLSRFGAYLFKVFVVMYFYILIIGFFLGALAVWFGRATGNYFAGVLIAGAGLLVVTVLLIVMRKKIALNSALANLSDILLNDDEK
ncbi:MAG: hypothetical protein ACOC11_03435 [Prolixibacteraceae bacterium]